MTKLTKTTFAALGTLLFGTAVAAAQQSGDPLALEVFTLQGQYATNNLVTGQAVTPLVELRDQRGRLVEGAAVTFRLPGSGPSGSFADGSQVYETYSDSRGQARAEGFSINGLVGRFTIGVVARYGDVSASAAIVQQNSDREFVTYDPPRKSWWSRWGKWVVLGGGAGGAAGLAIALTGGESSSGSVLSVQVSGVAVGSPR